MSNTDTAEKIERARRKREDELLLILLLLADDARRDTAVMLAHGKGYADVIATDLAPGVNAIARTAALAHADAFRRFGRIADVSMSRDAAGPLGVLARQYEQQARQAVDAMVQSITLSVDMTIAKFPDESPKLLAKSAFDNAGYTKDKPHNLDLGVERAIVQASNVGMLSAARQVSDAERRGGSELPGQAIGLRHHSVVDDRTTDICLDRHGLTLPVDDPFWMFNVPPLHPRCRSILLPVVGKYTADMVYPSVPPAPGWGVFPRGFFAQFGLAA